MKHSHALLAPIELTPQWGLMDLVSIFVSVCACIRKHILDMCGPISFVLGKKTTNDGIQKHIILFHDVIKDDQLAAILVVKK